MSNDPTARDDAYDDRALPLLRDLLAMAPAERDAALRLRAGDDAALAARVRRLLAQVDESELEAPAAEPLALHFGPYRALERIGQGGMGEVFRAERIDGSFRREVAIKRMHAGYAGLAERFLRERQLLARLQHPNIAQLIDGGLDARDQPWLAMELVRGEPLHRWCDSRRAPLETRVRLMIQLCRAIDHAHRHLVVHRDLKPGNVMVDAEGNTKLLDFGIARLLDDEGTEPTRTQTMTPAWSAPEQRNGEPATTASDLYQLGMLLRLLLSGLAPQPTSGRMSRGYAELRLRDAGAANAIAEARGLAPETLARRLHGDLDAIVALATAEQPTQRYPGASAFAEDLQRWLDGLAVRARGEERGYRLRRAARRYWPAFAAGVAALAFLGYHLYSMDLALRRVEAERVAALSARALEARQRERAERERDKANVIADYFGELFGTLDPADIARGDVPAHRLLERGMERLENDRTLPPAMRSQLLVATSSAFSHLDRDASVREALSNAIALLAPGTIETGDELAEAYSALALAHNSQGDYAAAGEAHRAGWALYAEGKATDPITRNELRIVRAMLYDRDGDKAASAALYREILPDTRRALAGASYQMRAVRNHIGALTNLGRLEKDPAVSERLHREAVALTESRDPHNLSMVLAVRNSLATAIIRQKDYDRAETLAEETLRRAKAYFVDTDTWLGLIHATAAQIDLAKGRHALAADRFDIASRIADQSLGKDNPVAQRVRQDAMMTDLAADRPDAAERKLRMFPAEPPAGPGPSTQAGATQADVARAYLACLRSPSPARPGQVRAVLANLKAPLADKFVNTGIDWAARCERAVAARR